VYNQNEGSIMNKIYIIGGANIDIQGVSVNDIKLYDSNIGKISYSYGGVARNIAENLSRLANEVSFISVFAQDEFGKQLLQNCHELNIDTSMSIIDPKAVSSVYLAVLDNNCDMLVGIVDMDILKKMTKLHLSQVLREIDRNDILVIDTNLEKEIIHYILTNVGCPVYVDPISTVKSEKIRDELKYITMLKPNRLEAEYLSGIMIKDKESAYQVLEYFLSHGLKEIIITLGKDGIIASDGNEYTWFFPPTCEIVSATGAGDAFLAGYIDAKIHKMNLFEAIKQSCLLAELTLKSEQTVSKSITRSNITAMLQDYQMENEIIT